MKKYFCDKCGKEMKKGYAWEDMDRPDKYLCKSCDTKFRKIMMEWMGK